MYHHLTRRHVSAMLPATIWEQVRWYLLGYKAHTRRDCARARREYLVATGRAS